MLLTAWFFLANGWEPLAIVLAAAAVHELGHWIVLRSLGAKVTGFCLSALGAVLETNSGRLSYGGELAAVLAGAPPQGAAGAGAGGGGGGGRPPPPRGGSGGAPPRICWRRRRWRSGAGAIALPP